MRGLVLHTVGSTPVLDDFSSPAPTKTSQKAIKVIAAGLNPVDRYFAMDASLAFPRVVGMEGVGITDGNHRVYFERTISPFGSIAEYALADHINLVDLPKELETEAALTIGVSGLAGWLPLTWKAHLAPNETVLILGATGAQGQVAVQAAKILGAKHVVAAGRHKPTLEKLRQYGADEIISFTESNMTSAIQEAATNSGYDVVIDSLFGAPFSALLDSGTLTSSSRVVVLGGSAGQDVKLGFRQLQSTKGATIAGYSSAFVPPDVKHTAYLDMAQYVMRGALHVETESFSLAQAEQAWSRQTTGPHKKIIVTM